MDSGDVLLILLGAAVVGLVSLGAELVRGRNGSRLDSAKRADDRWLGRNAYDRAALLELRDSASAVFREAMLDPVDHDLLEPAGSRLGVARSAIADEELRELAQTVRSKAGLLGLGVSGQDGAEVRQEMTQAVDALMDRAGRLVIETWGDPPVSPRPGAIDRLSTWWREFWRGTTT